MAIAATSLIIPVINQWDMLRGCLKSIAASTDLANVEVLLVGNGASGETARASMFLGNSLFGSTFRYLDQKHDAGFGSACDTGARAANGKYLVFIEPGIETLPGWLTSLITGFDQYPGLGATSPMPIFPEKTPAGFIIRHLGLLATPFGVWWPVHSGIPVTSPLAAKRRFVQALPGPVLATEKDKYLESGGFGGNFIDFSLKLGKLGRLTVNPESMVVDMEERSGFSTMPNPVSINNSLWESILEDDGLNARLTPWLVPLAGLPANPARDALAGRLADEELAEAIISEPYWRQGWLELLNRGNANNRLARAYHLLFPDPEDTCAFSRVGAVSSDREKIAYCARRLRAFIQPASKYLQAAKTALAGCLSSGEMGLARQLNGIIANYGDFSAKALPDLSRKLWDLERSLDIPQQPVDAISYEIWRNAIDAGLRRKELEPFLASSSAGKGPHLSILMPVYNPDPEHLEAALDSVLCQSWPFWQLCIADDASTNPRVSEILNEYAGKDSRIQIVWRDKNGHIAAATNSALKLAKYPWAILMDQDDTLTADALAFVARAITENPDALMFYSDEDHLVDGWEAAPYFKNGKWDLELIPVQNYVCHLAAYRVDRLRAIAGFREGFPGAQDHDLLLRYTGNEKTDRFIHIPHILYHWRAHAGSVAAGLENKPYATASADRATQAWLDEHAPGARVERKPGHAWSRIIYPLPRPMPKVSLIYAVPESPPAIRFPQAVELVFVSPENEGAQLARKLAPEIAAGNVVLAQAPANASTVECLNIGAKMASGDILGFLGAQIEPLADNWLEELVSALWRPNIGAVGGKVIFANGQLANAGYMGSDAGILRPLFAGRKTGAPFWYGWTALARTVEALDMACLFTKTHLFKKAGGLDANMGGWAGQDYCLRLGAMGERTIWWPYAIFRVSGRRLRQEAAPETFQQKWHGCVSPFNPNIMIEKDGFSLCTK